ncbi:regulatory protein RecX [Rickettsiella endosymbiont of Aleochara curtula]|uniref:regulatory protein RecX n=1 Tax=Rickettsiella endosymbiont of Aleochara curtula TaxID=3077936 RepID=UPI00313BB0CB
MLYNVDILEVDKKIRQIALEHLARREHTRFTLREKLIQKGFLHQSVEAVLDSLIEQGFLNEERFCEAFIQKRIRQGYGPIKITAECHQYGINNDIIFSQLPQEEDFWLDAIQKILLKKFRPSQLRKEQLRQIRYFQYRGFKLDQIKASLKIYLHQTK